MVSYKFRSSAQEPRLVGSHSQIRVMGGGKKGGKGEGKFSPRAVQQLKSQPRVCNSIERGRH